MDVKQVTEADRESGRMSLVVALDPTFGRWTWEGARPWQARLRLPCRTDRQRVTIGLPAGATGDVRHDLTRRTAQARIGRIPLTLA